MGRSALRFTITVIMVILSAYVQPVWASGFEACGGGSAVIASEEPGSSADQISKVEPEGTVPQAEELASVPQAAVSESALHPAENDTEVQIVEGEGILHPAEDDTEVQTVEGEGILHPAENDTEVQTMEGEGIPHPAENDTEVRIVEGEGITQPAEDSQPESEETVPALYGAGADTPLATAANGIPALYLSIDPEEFQKILDSPDHSYRSYEGTVRIELPEGYIGEFAEPDPAGIDKELALEFIRGRGNSTWGAEKNPFKFKLEKGTDLLGMGKNKHWVLLANHYDLSLLRNRIVTNMGRELGLMYTPEMVPVDFYVNGDYMGSYTVGEEIRIGKNRVEIDEIDPSVTSGDEITGGYLLALSPYYDEPSENKFTTAQGVEFLMDGPVFDSADPDEQAAREQYDYITDYLQRTENAIFGEGCKDEDGVSYAEYMDVESAARYWWVQQLCNNTDAYRTQSTYLYKERSGKLYWGPLWDFDYTMLEIPEQGGNPFNDQSMIWLDHLRENDPEFQDVLRKVWDEYDPIIERITEAGGVLDSYREEIRLSWEDNYDKWFAGKPVVGVDLDEDTELIREFLETMRKQVNENISELLTKVNSTVTYMDGEETLFSRTVRSGSRFADSLNTEKPEKDGFLFLGWVTPDGVHPEPYGYVNTDMILKADFIRDEDATGPDHIFFEPYDRWISINTGGAMLFYVLVPEDVQDTRVSWTVEDPEIAQLMVSSDRIIIIPQKIGDTVITGTMKSGLSESLVLHVYDPEDFPFREFTSAVPAETELTLYVGESGQVKFLLTPENSRPSLIFASDDEETALVEEDFGIVTGIAPGTCRITVRDPFSDVETEFTVIVLERPVPEDGNDPGEAPERTDEEKVPGNPADEKTPEGPAAHDITNMSAGKMQPERTGVRACLGDRKAGHQKGVANTRSSGQSRPSPDTGDDSDARIWILLALVSLTGIIGVRRKYRLS